MFRKALVLGAGALTLAFAFGMGSAHAVDPQYTDGTQCSGAFCGVASNPPPTDPVWADGQVCHVDIVDPPTFVFMTEHFVYGTVEPPAGVVPVHDDASVTFPYHGVAPAEFPIDVTAFVAGKRGWRSDTWNIGKGVTAWVPFDCTGDTTSTTASTSTTTSTSTTSTTIASEGSTVPSSTTTIASEGSTVQQTSTSVALEGSTVPSTNTTVSPSTTTGTLPFTGSGAWPLAGLGVASLLAGAGGIATRRRGRSSR
jgi:hypothetical protein